MNLEFTDSYMLDVLKSAIKKIEGENIGSRKVKDGSISIRNFYRSIAMGRIQYTEEQLYDYLRRHKYVTRIGTNHVALPKGLNEGLFINDGSITVDITTFESDFRPTTRLTIKGQEYFLDKLAIDEDESDPIE